LILWLEGLTLLLSTCCWVISNYIKSKPSASADGFFH
jgi:hypothetical protein